MIILFISVSSLVLLTAYFVVLPRSKKRPVLIKHKGLLVYGTVFAVILCRLSDLLPFVFLIVITALLLLLFKPWFVYGLTNAMITDALERAASAARTPLEKTDGYYRIDNSLQIRIRSFGGKVSVISFKKAGESKKAILTTGIFKKFMQNFLV